MAITDKFTTHYASLHLVAGVGCECSYSAGNLPEGRAKTKESKLIFRQW
jgi:hypothetical protein